VYLTKPSVLGVGLVAVATDVGPLVRPAATRSTPKPSMYLFNDIHAMQAFVAHIALPVVILTCVIEIAREYLARRR
jgi:hypothetical protein